jgi:hypothetical protein
MNRRNLLRSLLGCVGAVIGASFIGKLRSRGDAPFNKRFSSYLVEVGEPFDFNGTTVFVEGATPDGTVFITLRRAGVERRFWVTPSRQIPGASGQ